ncbi:MAG: hypothetical protein KAI47_11915, partial [Deltaproteobacteria bacterium]|nr:hypothetical protein [Deltaproteobacteria bacterium]
IAPDVTQQRRWIDALAEALNLSPSTGEIARLGEAKAHARIVVATYEALTPGALARHRDAFGLVIFDGVDSVGPIRLLSAVRGLTARHLVGLAREASRDDQLHGPLYLVLGGIAHELPAQGNTRALRLTLRRRPTAFTFDYGGRSHYQALVAALAADKSRAKQIATDVATEARSGHPCLVVSERRDHLATLLDALPADISADLVTSDVRPAERADRVARFNRGELRVILATSQIALETVKSPGVSRLFITFPIAHAKKLEGLSERLLASAPGKEDAIVYDYDDLAVAPLNRGHAKRHVILTRVQRKAEEAFGSWAQLSFEL